MKQFVKHNFIPIGLLALGLFGFAYIVIAATITNIAATDLISDSRSTINTNFTNLNTDKLEQAINLSNITIGTTGTTTIRGNIATSTFSGSVSANGGSFSDYLTIPAFIATSTSRLSTISGNLIVEASSTISALLNVEGILGTSSSTISILNVNTCNGCPGAVGGSNTQVQFNNAGVLGGDAGFIYSASADRATLTYGSTTSFSVSTNLYGGWYGSSSVLDVTGDVFLSGTSRIRGDWYGSSTALTATRLFNTNASTTYLSLDTTGNLIIGARGNPVLNTAGQLVVDTNTDDNSLQYFASSTQVLTYRRQWSATIGSTTPLLYRVPIGEPDEDVVVDGVRAQAVCWTDACTGGAEFTITHGTTLDNVVALLAGTSNVHSANSGTSTHIAFTEFNDNTIAAGEEVYLRRTAASTTIDYLNIIINYRYAP